MYVHANYIDLHILNSRNDTRVQVQLTFHPTLQPRDTMDHDALLLLLGSLAAVAAASLWLLCRGSATSSSKLPLPPGPRGWPVLG
ncbi:hypothetical protein, partial [Pseudonocardia sp. EV170527-09]|uniref:hypothetical protein n=1 Tax=Pseudonocardia sp. EV170527-09 TaxID=2603411 RepID=UPI0019600803